MLDASSITEDDNSSLFILFAAAAEGVKGLL
jgi:hypothetical protein